MQPLRRGRSHTPVALVSGGTDGPTVSPLTVVPLKRPASASEADLAAYMATHVDPVFHSLLAAVAKARPTPAQLRPFLIAQLQAGASRDGAGTPPLAPSSVLPSPMALPSQNGAGGGGGGGGGGGTTSTTPSLPPIGADSLPSPTPLPATASAAAREPSPAAGAAFVGDTTADAPPAAPAATTADGVVPVVPVVPSDGVEADTADAEAVSPDVLKALMLPPGMSDLPSSGPGDVFSLSYSRAVLAGWVKQHSPACAAASVAGAWNAVHGWDRSHPKALCQDDVVEVLKALVQAKVDAAAASFQRLLGAPIDGLLSAVMDALEARGTPLSQKGVKAVQATRLACELACQVYAEVDGDLVPTVQPEEVLKVLPPALRALAPPSPSAAATPKADAAAGGSASQGSAAATAIASPTPAAPPAASDAAPAAPSGDSDTPTGDAPEDGKAGDEARASPPIITSAASPLPEPLWVYQGMAFDRLREMLAADYVLKGRPISRTPTATASSPTAADSGPDNDAVDDGDDGDDGDDDGVQDGDDDDGDNGDDSDRDWAATPAAGAGVGAGAGAGDTDAAPVDGVVGAPADTADGAADGAADTDAAPSPNAGDTDAAPSPNAGDADGGSTAATTPTGGCKPPLVPTAGGAAPEPGSLAAAFAKRKKMAAKSARGGAARRGRSGSAGGRRKSSAGKKSRPSSGRRTPKSGSARRASGASTTKSGGWQWRKQLTLIFGKLGGIAKLTRPRPSTAFFGNWGILQAVTWLQQHSTDDDNVVSARILMGRGPKSSSMDIPISANDAPKARARQWGQLKEAFCKQHTALVFHLKNHYALITGLRDYETADGERRREVLATRRGQRPNTWITYREVRDLMLRWGGHKIMAVSLKEVRQPSSSRVPSPMPASGDADSTAAADGTATDVAAAAAGGDSTSGDGSTGDGSTGDGDAVAPEVEALATPVDATRDAETA